MYLHIKSRESYGRATMSATRWRRDREREQERAIGFDVVWDGDMGTMHVKVNERH